jgi:hypothetical protein
MAGRRHGTLDRTQATRKGARRMRIRGMRRAPGVPERMDFEDPAARGA